MLSKDLILISCCFALRDSSPQHPAKSSRFFGVLWHITCEAQEKDQPAFGLVFFDWCLLALAAVLTAVGRAALDGRRALLGHLGVAVFAIGLGSHIGFSPPFDVRMRKREAFYARPILKQAFV